MKNLTIVGIIINKDNKISRSTNTRDKGRPQTSEWIRSKISVDIDSLLLKGKAGCVPNQNKIQSKFFVDTEPHKPLEAKCCTWKVDAWPSRACQRVRKGIEETTVATEIGATGRKRRVSIGNTCPTLGRVPSSCPVLGSYTVHPK